MPSWQFTWRNIGGRSLAGILPLLLWMTSRCYAENPPVSAVPGTGQALSLQACRQIALEQQPALTATRASLKAAQDRASALENLRVPTLLARDLPIRRKQSALGVTIAQGGIIQAEAETLYGVTFSYLTALYADQQIRIADKQIRERLNGLLTLVRDEATRKARRDVILEQHENLVKSFLHTLDGRVQEARQGKSRALAALREAMGVGPDFVFTLPQRDLPCPRVNPQGAELVALALARRGELIQANALVEVICLEIDAQATSCKPTMRTFASGSDIHAKLIPSGDVGGLGYHPAMVGPEMPPSLTGSRAARMEQARDYHQRRGGGRQGAQPDRPGSGRSISPLAGKSAEGGPPGGRVPRIADVLREDEGELQPAHAQLSQRR